MLCVGADEAESGAAPRPSAASPTSCVPTGWPAPRSEVVETLERFARAGSQRVYLQMLDLADLDHLRLVAAEVMPHV